MKRFLIEDLQCFLVHKGVKNATVNLSEQVQNYCTNMLGVYKESKWIKRTMNVRNVYVLIPCIERHV